MNCTENRDPLNLPPPIAACAENPSTNSAAEGWRLDAVDRRVVVICWRPRLAGPARRQFQRKRLSILRTWPGYAVGQSGQHVVISHLRYHRESRQPHQTSSHRRQRSPTKPATHPKSGISSSLRRPLCGIPADQRRSKVKTTFGLVFDGRHSHVESIASRASNHGDSNLPLSYIQ